MNIKDYLHLYLGCEIDAKDGIGTLTTVGIDGYCARNKQDGHLYYYDHTIESKLILRSFSDMSDEEMDDIWHGIEPKNVLVMSYKNSGMERKVALCSERTRYLLSKGFDLFGLIEAGLAISATKPKTKD